MDSLPVGTLAHRAALGIIKSHLPTGKKCVVIRFTGSGDSGDVDDWYLTDDPAGSNSEPYNDSDFFDRKLDMRQGNDAYEGMTYDDIFTKWAWPLADAVDWDWVNNEGGYVEVTFDLVLNEITVGGGYYVRESVKQTGSGYDIFTMQPAAKDAA